MSTIPVVAHRWSGGWELHLDGSPATQVTTLDKATDQVRDYLDTIYPKVDHSTWTIDLHLADDTLDHAITTSRQATQAASEATLEAARQARGIVRDLRAAGLSVTDTAAILGVSRGRVSQLS